MSVNQPRPQLCKTDGCNRSATFCGLCQDHWTLAWAEYQEARAAVAEEDTQPVLFDPDCARAFDNAQHVEVLDAQGRVMYMAPSRIVTRANGNGRTR